MLHLCRLKWKSFISVKDKGSNCSPRLSCNGVGMKAEYRLNLACLLGYKMGKGMQRKQNHVPLRSGLLLLILLL